MTKIVQVIQPSGQLDRQHIELLEQEIQHFLDRGVKSILLDFQDIVSIDKSNLLYLKQILQNIRAKEGNFYICSLNEQVRATIEITGNLEYFDPLKSRQEFEDTILSSRIDNS